MEAQEITLVRVYLREGEHKLGKIIDFLHDQAKVRGVTVLRGIEGFSEDGTIRTGYLIDLSMDLPLIVEFYDEQAKVEGIISKLIEDMHLTHIITLPARAYTRIS